MGTKMTEEQFNEVMDNLKAMLPTNDLDAAHLVGLLYIELMEDMGFSRDSIMELTALLYDDEDHLSDTVEGMTAQ